MREVKWYEDNKWRLSKGLPERKPGLLPSYEELCETEWSSKFDELAKGKLIQAAYRYGLLRKNNAYDFIESMKKKIQRYEETHNLELMVDVRNYAMLEFLKPKYADAFYDCEDDTCHATLKTHK